ncbi:MAG: type II secretion system F family protein, partial [Nitrospirae bacterium]|nr:type II secretion system F family protein [Nitrospirota bacterium]
KDHIVSAMIYPVILILTGGASIIVLLTYVLPKFTSIFKELGTSLPLATKMLLAFSVGLKSYGIFLMLLLIPLIFFMVKYKKTEEGRIKWDTIKLRLMGKVIKEIETARFCRTLGTLLKSGVPLIQAMNNAKEVLSNRIMSSAVEAVSRDVKEGKGIAVPLSRTNVFPPLAISMIKVGEETGQLDAMLMKIAHAYEKSLRITIKRVIGFVEPAMILIMGLIIGFIVLSMLMAIFSITEMPF